MLFNLRHLGSSRRKRLQLFSRQTHYRRKAGWMMLPHFTSQEQRPLFRLGVDSTNVFVNHFKTNHLDCADQERARQQPEPA